MLRRYPGVGEPLACEPITKGLLNHGYRVSTTSGSYFLKHHLDKRHLDDTSGERAAIVRQHRATQRLQSLGVPVVPPLTDTRGDTVTVIGERCYALHPWVDGLHRVGSQLTLSQSRRLGALLGTVHTGLEQVMAPRDGPHPTSPPARPGHRSPDAADTFELIDDLLAAARGQDDRDAPRDAFDELAVHRLVERRALLEQHAPRRPPTPDGPATGWVHGDFHPLNLLYRGADPVAIVDWDRLAV
ncbi:phosphotransferase, partial [Kitasatospora purpeofusca]|uniref:phosphotransferase n=1 Tax=Kitasatospora purpeofusca TaxID=67352 RepID=UPI00365EF1FD